MMRTKNKVAVELPLAIVDDVSDRLAALLDVDIPEDNKGTAEITRQLLRLSDELALAAAAVRNEYWAIRGENAYVL